MLGAEHVNDKQRMTVATLRRATAEERRNYEPLLECAARFIPKITSESDVERWKLLPPGFDMQVFLRVLQIVNAYDTAPGLMIILHLPDTEDQAHVDLKRVNPGVSHAWKVGNYSVTRHQFTPAMLETWSKGGAVIIHACTGVVLDVGAKLLENGESTICVQGGTKNNTALKCSIQKNSLALVKKLKSYKDPETGDAITFDSVPDPRAALDPRSCTGTPQSLPKGMAHVKRDFPKLNNVRIYSPGYTRDYPSQYLAYDLQRQFDIHVIDEESIGIHAEPIDVSNEALESVDDAHFWEIASRSMEPKDQLKAEVRCGSRPWSSEADIPDHVMPEGFPKVVLLRLFDLLDRLNDDALIVVGPVKSLPLDKMCSHPKRAQQWRRIGFEALNIFQDFDDTTLKEWTLDGAVCVHHASGDVIDITIKLLQAESIRWYIDGGFKKDTALKCATLSSPCLALCRAQPDQDDPTPPYILLCSSQECSENATGSCEHGRERIASVWKLPCGSKENPRIDQATLNEVREHLRLQEFDSSVHLPGVPDQAGEALPASVAWNESSWCTESHDARNDVEVEQEEYLQSGESSTGDIADLADLAAIQASEQQQAWQQLAMLIEDCRELSSSQVLHRLQDSGFSSNKLRQVYQSLRRLASTGHILEDSMQTLAEEASLQKMSALAALLDLYSEDALTHISTLNAIRMMPLNQQTWLMPAVFKLFKRTERMQVKVVAVDTMLALPADYVTDVWLEPLSSCMSSAGGLCILAAYAIQKLGMADFCELPDFFRKPGLTGFQYLENIGVKASELDSVPPLRLPASFRGAGDMASELKSAGYTAGELKSAGYTAGELKSAGWTALQLKSSGYTAGSLKSAGYTAGELVSAGYTAGELQSMGYTVGEVQSPGCFALQLKSAGYTAGELISGGYNKSSGYTAGNLKSAGYSAGDLVSAGYNAEDLKFASYTASELIFVGFNGNELRHAGYTAGELKSVGFTALQLKSLGYTVSHLERAGYSAGELKSAAYTAEELKPAGYIALQLKSAGYAAFHLKRAGYTAGELKSAGYTAGELTSVGYIAGELQSAGYTDEELKTAGDIASELKSAGYTVLQVKSAGYTALQVKSAGYTAGELHCAGYTAAELQSAGYTAGELKSVGYSAGELKSAGYMAGELKSAGYTAGELKSAGYAASRLERAGYAAGELKSAGYTAEELTSAGYTLRQVRSAGYTALQLTSAGYTVCHLKHAGYTVEELRSAGYTASELQSAGYTTRELKSAGYWSSRVNVCVNQISS